MARVGAAADSGRCRTVCAGRASHRGDGAQPPDRTAVRTRHARLDPPLCGGELLQSDFGRLSDEALYRNLDKLHPHRAQIESALAERERTLFNLDDTLLLYDLTSTYFEGLAARNPQAQRGYSRDQRPDCKQVVVGLVLNGDGFPRAHEIFAGNRHDSTTLDEMLSALERRTGKRSDCTVVVDRGMADAENLHRIKTRGHHYLVAARQPERDRWLAEFEAAEGFAEVIRRPSPRNPAQVKSQLLVKRAELGDQVYALCLSEDRQDKDRAIRQKQEGRLLKDLERLAARIGKGQLKQRDLINQAIGRLRERYPRVARYYQIHYDPEQAQLVWQEDSARKARAEQLDGAYLLKTDRQELSAEEICAYTIYSPGSRLPSARSRPRWRNGRSFTSSSIAPKPTSFCACSPITCWSVSRSVSSTAAFTTRGGPCASN